MAGPSILVKIIGDTSGLSKSADEVSNKLGATAKKMSGAMSSALGGLNVSGALGPVGDVLNTVVRGLDAVATSGKGASMAIAGVGAAVTTVGVLATVAGSKQQAAQNGVKAAVEAAGQSWDDNKTALEAQQQAYSKYGFTVTEVADAQAKAVIGTHNAADALTVVNAGMVTAVKNGGSLADSTLKWVREYNGSQRILKEFGLTALPTVEEATKQVTTAQKEAVNADRALLSAQNELASAYRSLRTAQEALASASRKLRDEQRQVNEVMSRSGQYGRDLTDANLSVKQSAESLTTSQQSLFDIQKKLFDIAHGTGEFATDQAHAQLALQHANVGTTESANSLAQAQLDLRAAQFGGNPIEIAKAQNAVTLAQLGTMDAAQGLTDAQANLQKINNEAIPGTKEYVDLQTQLQQAQLGVESAQNAQVDAQAKYQELLNQSIPGTKEYGDMMERLATAQQNVADAHQGVVDAQAKIANAQQNVADALKNQADAYAKVADAQALLAATGDPTASARKAIEETSGLADAKANTTLGKFEANKSKFLNWFAEIGTKYGGLIILIGGIAQVVGVIGIVLSTGLGAAFVAVLPEILIVVAIIAAVIAIAWLLYKNWDTIWSGIKRIARDVWQWMQDAWDHVVGAIKTGISAVGSFFATIWDGIKTAASTVWRWIQTGWDGVVDFFSKLPGRMARAGAGVFSWLANGFVDAVNFIIRLWNDLKFTTPKFKLPFPPHTEFPSVTIGVPHIPSLPHLATGGIAMGPTLALIGEAGPEAVVPLNKMGRGAAVYIEHAQFNDPVDIDVLSRRIEFALSAGLPV